MRATSIWLATGRETAYPALRGDRSTEAVVVGAGVAGASIALALCEKGLDVTLIDRDRVGCGATVRSTVKVSAAQGLRGQQIADARGEEHALAYLRASRAALASIVESIDRFDIGCDLARRAHVLFAESPELVGSLEREMDLLRRAGVDARWATDVSLPFPVAGAVVVPDQAVLHPLSYVQGLVATFLGLGGTVCEGTEATEVDGSTGLVHTHAGTIRADHVVVTTHASIDDRDLLAARLDPIQEYAIAGPIEGALPPETYISVDDRWRSLRTATDRDGTPLLIVVGEEHRVGEGGDTERYPAILAGWARERFAMSDPVYGWDTFDLFPIDGVPMIGRASRTDGSGWVATGFGGWGVTNAAVAARIVTSGILGRAEGDEDLFDPGRNDALRHPGRFLTMNAKVAAHWVGDRLDTSDAAPIELGPGDAAVLEVDGSTVAVHRDRNGELHAVDAVCTHLGCVVAWNPGASTWDCPCHGSRFGVDGDVVAAPATEPLRDRSDLLADR